MPGDEDDDAFTDEDLDEDLDGDPQLGEDVADLGEEVGGRVEGDGPDPPRVTTEVLLSQTTASMSPFPDESWLTTAEKFHPGTTGMLLEDFIAERKHSRAVDRRAARLDEKSFEKFAEYQNTQLARAGLIALIIAVGGIILALTDHSTAGLAVLVAETTGLVAALLVAGRRRPGAEIEKPSDGSAGPPTAGE